MWVIILFFYRLLMKIKNNYIQFTAFDDQIPQKCLLHAATLWDKILGFFQKSRLFQLEDVFGQKVQVNVKDLKAYAWSCLSAELSESHKNILKVWFAKTDTPDLGQMLVKGNLRTQFNDYLNTLKMRGRIIVDELTGLNNVLETTKKENTYYWLGSTTKAMYKQTLMNFIVKLADISEEIVDLTVTGVNNKKNQAIKPMIVNLKMSIASYRVKETHRFAEDFSKSNPINILIKKLEVKRHEPLSNEDKQYLTAYAEYNYRDLIPKSQNQEISPPELPKDKQAKKALLAKANEFSEIIEDAWIDCIESRRNHPLTECESSVALQTAIEDMQKVIAVLPNITAGERSTQELLTENLKKIKEMKKGLESAKSPLFDERLKAKGYTKGKSLGKGSQGYVYLVNKNGKDYAAKMLNSENIIPRKQWWKFKAGEVNASKVQHPNVLGIKEVIHNESGVTGIIMDIVPGGELIELVENNKIDAQKAKKYMRDIAQGLKALHDKGIIHHDMKLENVMLDAEGNCKLIDFGYARNTAKLGPIKEAMGSEAYAAPELFKGKPHGLEVDMFSLGIILFAMLTGCFPNRYSDKSVKHDYKSINDPQAVDLIKKLLVTDPAKRPKIDEVLAHPYLAEDKISSKAIGS